MSNVIETFSDSEKVSIAKGLKLVRWIQAIMHNAKYLNTRVWIMWERLEEDSKEKQSLEVAFMELKESNRKLSQRVELLQTQVNKYNEEVEEHTKLLSDTLERLDTQVQSVFDNKTTFDEFEKQLADSKASDIKTKGSLEKALEVLDSTEQEIKMRPAIGSQVRARGELLRNLESQRQKLRGHLDKI